MKNKGPILLIFLFSLLVLLFSLRGRYGNPNAQDLIKNEWLSSGPFELSPERGRFALTYSLVEDNSVSFSTDIARFVTPDLGFINGKYVSLFAPGVSFIATPLYLIGRYFNLSQVFTFSTSMIFALFNVVLITLIVKKLTKNIYVGLISSMTFLFATDAWSYAITLYQHHLTTFFILAAIYILQNYKKRVGSILLGIIFVIAFFVEYPTIIFFIPILVYFFIKNISVAIFGKGYNLDINLKEIIYLGVASIVISIPFLFYNQKTYANPFQLSGTVESIQSIDVSGRPQFENYAHVGDKTASGFFKLDRLPISSEVLLTSKDRGVMYFSPVMILGLIGLFGIKPRNKTITQLVIATSVFILALYGLWGDPWGGWAFGPRYMIPFFAMLAILLGLAIEKYKNKLWFVFLYFSLLFYSLSISTIGAFTTNKIPPSSETELANYPALVYLHNFDLLKQGVTNSYFYNQYITGLMPLEYFVLYVWSIVLLVFIACYFMILKSNQSN